MNSLDDFAQRLEAAGHDGWEDAYARTSVELSYDQAYELMISGRPWADWFAFRFDAGAPGVALPAHEQALAAVLGGKDGTPRDAYRVVFAPHPMPDEAPTGLILVVLMHSAGCALKGETTWFATWLAARAGLAALAFGQPDRAWHILDSLTIKGQRHPHLDALAIFEPLRGNAALERTSFVDGATGSSRILASTLDPSTPAASTTFLEDDRAGGASALPAPMERGNRSSCASRGWGADRIAWAPPSSSFAATLHRRMRSAESHDGTHSDHTAALP